MVDDLHQEPDEKQALRKALCMLIVLLDDPDPDVAALITYLLMMFKPLAAHFRENRHPLVAETECLRAPRAGETRRSDFEGVGLLMNHEQMKKLLERTAEIVVKEIQETGASYTLDTERFRLPEKH